MTSEPVSLSNLQHKLESLHVIYNAGLRRNISATDLQTIREEINVIAEQIETFKEKV